MRTLRKNSIVFLGGGRISSALIAGLRLAGDKTRFIVYDRNAEKLRSLKREFAIEPATDLDEAVNSADTLIIAVRPSQISLLFREIKARAEERPRLAISLAAGIPLANLRRGLGSPVRWARAMPSPVCRIGRGLTALTYDRSVGRSDRLRVRQLFTKVGEIVELPERRFDAFNAAYSPSHGYHALATLANAGQHAGLDRKTALVAAAHALGVGIFYWQESGADVSELLSEAATPGGTANATMVAMEKAGYSKAVAKGLQAGIGQARKNARL